LEPTLTVNSELAREKMWARIHLIPALQAEEDRDQVRRYLADRAREKELLGTETKVYHSDRYVHLHNGADHAWLMNDIASCGQHSRSHQKRPLSKRSIAYINRELVNLCMRGSTGEENAVMNLSKRMQYTRSYALFF
jgi:hypothetical protein